MVQIDGILWTTTGERSWLTQTQWKKGQKLKSKIEPIRIIQNQDNSKGFQQQNQKWQFMFLDAPWHQMLLAPFLVTYVFLVEQESCDNFCHWHFWCQPELQADTNSDFAWPFNGGNKTNCATADQNVSRNLAWPGWALETVLISDKAETRNTAECFWDEYIMW